MSKIGRKAIPLPEGVTVKISDHEATVTGPKGELTVPFRPEVTVSQEEGTLVVKPKGGLQPKLQPNTSAFWGLARSLLNNAVTGVFKGFERSLLLEGMGYRVVKNGPKLVFALGFSHPVEFDSPPGITLDVEGNNKVIVRGIDKHIVGQTAASIRQLRPPEPYKGKGIRYEGEVLRRKAGKAGKVGAGTAGAGGKAA
ncbi:MAG: 50S ribosomal protein L6 [bacterium]|nr:50S ribosomal protein L6 [bacterium]